MIYRQLMSDKKMCNYFKSNYFPKKKDGFFIEAGAADGYSGSVCFGLEQIGWTGVNVEANPHFMEALIENRPDSINIHTALSNKVGTAPLTIPQCKEDFLTPGGSSLSFWDYREEKGIKSKIYIDVPVTTYYQLCQDHNITHVDLFVLDVEGEELRVIEGIEDGDPLPEIFYIEDNKVDSDELDEAMSSLGYKGERVNQDNTVYRGAR